MDNKAMERKIKSGEAIDISQCEEIDKGLYLLAEFKEGVDYCDAKKEAWVWSMGRRLSDGQIHASLGNGLYQNAEYECLFLR